MTRRSDGTLPPVRKSLGQHFLRDRGILARIADALEPIGRLTVVEIGPGRGALTELLAERAQRVVAIEYDRMLAHYLSDRFRDRQHVQVIQADVLAVDPQSLAGGPYLVVGNVPYYITTPILFHCLTPPRPERAVYLIQREVAERLGAEPGSRDYGALTVNVRVLADVATLMRVPAGAFTPPPKVESAVVRLTPLAEPLVRPDEERPFRDLVQRVFSFRRKQMRRVLREAAGVSAETSEMVLGAAGIDPEARPETLAPSRFVALLRALPAI